MSRFETLRHKMLDAVRTGQARRFYESTGVTPSTGNLTQQANHLTATVLAMSCIRKFYEGYFGTLLGEKIAEGRKLRTSDDKAYAAAMRTYESLIPDLRGIRAEMRVVEAMTSSDLAYGIAAARDAVRRENLPPFQTDLFDIVRRRTVEDFNPVRARGGVNLLNRFLTLVAEGANVEYTGWVGQGEFYSVAKYELALALTWEALQKDKLGEFQDAMYELGQAAARTRAWAVVDAIRRMANRLPLPNGGLGPNISNINAVRSYLANQLDAQGRPVARALTDLFVPIGHVGTADTAMASQQLAYVGYAAGNPQQLPTANPVYRAATVHGEEILTLMGVDDYPGHNINDWIAVARGTTPVEVAVLRGFEGGPRTLTRIAETVEFDSGSFSQMIFEVKVLDALGAAVSDKTGILIASGNSNLQQ
ncbi:hypothetical protein [Deinococcus multiflagellatus]|uniref:Uncharacterized protein n=1 Tax=Deinococcus multiflagellatus TaxID=1656887 RepID=A0ABW1ZPT7_9DEIO|nr:hypothetical protein [Deinococcus multiflagellatus]MBZ9715281.1 hypothetical protein [Deinococcus multiflagellatus]